MGILIPCRLGVKSCQDGVNKNLHQPSLCFTKCITGNYKEPQLNLFGASHLFPCNLSRGVRWWRGIQSITVKEGTVYISNCNNTLIGSLHRNGGLDWGGGGGGMPPVDLKKIQ